MRVLVTLAAAASLATSAWAGTIIAAGSPLGSGLTISGGASIFSSVATAAAGFVLPAGANYTLDDAQVLLTFDGEANPINLTAQLFADTSGNPSGSALVSFSNSGICPCANGAVVDATLTPQSAFTLLASHTYWLALEAIGSDRNIAWEATTTSNPYTGIATYAGSRRSSTYPATESLPSTSQVNLIFAIDATQVVVGGVPEPATAGLAGLGVLGLVWVKRRGSRVY